MNKFQVVNFGTKPFAQLTVNAVNIIKINTQSRIRQRTPLSQVGGLVHKFMMLPNLICKHYNWNLKLFTCSVRTQTWTGNGMKTLLANCNNSRSEPIVIQ